MIYMAKAGKKSPASKRPVKSNKTIGKVRTKRLTNHTKASPKDSNRKKTISRTGKQQSSDTTYIFECTRPGWGYRIPRKEKAELGALHSDLKSTNDHHKE